MIRKIIPIAAIALAIGTLTVAPRVATASVTSSVTVTATVPASATVTTAPATLASWTSSNQVALFGVTVTTSDPSGYYFYFYDSSATGTTSYTLTGQAHSSKGTFVIADPKVDYNDSPNNGNSTPPTYTTSSENIFTCDFSAPPTVADTYTDTVTVVVNLN